MLNYASMFWKIIRLKKYNLVNNSTCNIQSHYVKIALYFVCLRMPDTFYVGGFLDHIREKTITMIISK